MGNRRGAYRLCVFGPRRTTCGHHIGTLYCIERICTFARELCQSSGRFYGLGNGKRHSGAVQGASPSDGKRKTLFGLPLYGRKNQAFGSFQ